MAPRLTKPECLALWKLLRHPRGWGIRASREFLNRFPWLSFLLQAPQALYTVTGDLMRAYGRYRGLSPDQIKDIRGWGLVLGSPMAFLNDSYWALIRTAQGKKVTIVGPPPSDPLGKATRFLAQAPIYYYYQPAFTLEEHILLTFTQVQAMQILLENSDPQILDSRAEGIYSTPVIAFEPWNPATIDVLLEHGWEPMDEPSPPLPGLGPAATYGDVHQVMMMNYPKWEFDFSANATHSFLLAAMSIAAADVAEDFFRALFPKPSDVEPLYTDEELLFARMYEMEIFPRFPVTPDDLRIVYTRALQMAAAAGVNTPGPQIMREAFTEKLGGWYTSPPVAPNSR